VKLVAVTAMVLVPGAGGADEAAQATAVEAALVAAEPQLHRCWERAAAVDYHVEGVVELTVRVGASGRAERVDLRGDSTGHPGLAACARQVFGGASFGGAFAAGDAVEIPVTFRAEPNVTVRAEDVPAVKIRGSAGTARVLIDRASSGAEQAALSLIELPPAGALPAHTADHEEIFYVLAGTLGTGAGAPVGPGDAIQLAAGSALRSGVAGRKGARLLVLDVPAQAVSLRAGQLGVGRDASAAGTRRAPAAGAGRAPAAETGGAHDSVRLYRSRDAAEQVIANGAGGFKLLIQGDGAASVSLGRIGLLPDVTLPEHAHDVSAEILYVVAGKGEVLVDGEPFPFEAGSAIHIPPKTKHSFRGITTVDAVDIHAPAEQGRGMKR
jgi:quercetin dioxygenase-like cupin family protein